jgi:tetratricopeptide (TPR) repeat protein
MKYILTSFLAMMFTIAFPQQTVFDQNKVITLFQNQEFEELVQYLEPFSSQDSLNIQLLGYLGNAYNMSERPKQAARYYEKIISIDSLNITANQNLVNLYFNKNEEAAQMLTQRLIRLQPHKSSYYRTMGMLMDRKKLKDSALIFYEAAYKIDSNDLRNVSSLADILIDLENFERADSIISSGMQRDSMYIPLLISAIRSAYVTDHYDKCISPGQRLMQVGDVTLKPLTQLILSYYLLNRYDECIEVCEYLRSQEIDAEAVNYYEAKAWAKLGDFDKSNDLLRLCINSSISERAEQYYLALADNQEETENFKKAIAYYDTAFYLFKSPLVKYNVGRIYETKLKNSEQANKYFKGYLLIADTATPDEKKVYYYLRNRYRTKKTKN